MPLSDKRKADQDGQEPVSRKQARSEELKDVLDISPSKSLRDMLEKLAEVILDSGVDTATEILDDLMTKFNVSSTLKDFVLDAIEAAVDIPFFRFFYCAAKLTAVLIKLVIELSRSSIAERNIPYKELKRTAQETRKMFLSEDYLQTLKNELRQDLEVKKMEKVIKLDKEIAELESA